MSKPDKQAHELAAAYLEYRATVRDENRSHDDVCWAKEKLDRAANVYEALLAGGPLAVVPPEEKESRE